MNLSKLQSKAVKEFDEKYVIKSNAGTGLLRYTDADKIKQFLSDQIQKAYSKGREEVLKELRVRIDTWGGFEDDGGNLCHYDSQIIEYLDDLSIDYDGIAETVIKLHKQSK